ncbi:DUF1611 domain-containing protein [Methanotorris formicicus]|uniref:D-glutamate N-acetyltransferase-like C-terminal domain-containing protein n=1 Tax=Methanotorris formicicus Mc-S-70 TaxID=647171 RepID=H1L0M1_9EURY|nr:DUF1611 domain-containing protein [Methanotorris formicicus]EHP84638.1 protein of unknown function DUF1611 [Methanotorris formicicus Mc-S-70]
MVERAKISHENKVSDGLRKFSNITIDEKYYDTFIWTREILYREDLKIWTESIASEIEKGKNIYNMARLYRVNDVKNLMDLAYSYGVEVFDTSNPQRFKELRKFAEEGLKGIKSKVITIMGTGRQCGKFTTSFILKKELEKRGYSVGMVGTDPHALLCGADEMVIPQVIESCHVAPTIFGAVKKVDLMDRDVIIVSSQTGILADALEVGTGRGGGVISTAILMGSKPDFTILATKETNIELIKKNIKIIELLSDKEVVGITFNSKNLGFEKTEKVINYLSSNLNLPVADVVKNINLKDIVDCIGERI